jgi:hypothetical protein
MVSILIPSEARNLLWGSRSVADVDPRRSAFVGG